ncbi:MAG: hypothetical protein SH868_10675, partial [Bythopirellula sp.]|nr:hypothetical protein [Bythopirellula sp.]
MADQNSHDFDPYYKWLGIPPELQPADHYRLLGLRLFEEDREVIAIAADRQMAHVKTFAAGKYSRESQSLLDELARAKLCLLSAKEKAAYDSVLLDKARSFESIAAIVSKLQPTVTDPTSSPRAGERKTTAQSASIPSESIKINLHGKSHTKKRPSRNLVVGWYIFTMSLGILGFIFLQMKRNTIESPPIVNKPSINSNKASGQSTITIPQKQPILVGVIPDPGNLRFFVQLSKPSTKDTTVRYALTGKYLGGKEIKEFGTSTIRRGNTSAFAISVQEMITAEIELLRVSGEPQMELDYSKNIALIDNSKSARPSASDQAQRKKPNENDSGLTTETERTGWGQDFELEEIQANPTTTKNGRLFYQWQLKENVPRVVEKHGGSSAQKIPSGKNHFPFIGGTN